MNPILTLHDPAAASAHYAAGLWRDDTFYSLLAAHARKQPEALALRDSSRALTWEQVHRWVDG